MIFQTLGFIYFVGLKIHWKPLIYAAQCRVPDWTPQNKSESSRVTPPTEDTWLCTKTTLDNIHRDRRWFKDKQGRGMKWFYGKRGVNGMEGRVKKLNLNLIFASVGLGALSCGFLFWAWACLCYGRHALG